MVDVVDVVVVAAAAADDQVDAVVEKQANGSWWRMTTTTMTTTQRFDSGMNLPRSGVGWPIDGSRISVWAPAAVVHYYQL